MTARSLLLTAHCRLGRAIDAVDAEPLEALGLIELARADLAAAVERLRVAAAASLAKSPDGG